MSNEEQAARIKFRLRRGMLELDTMLHRFYEQKFTELSQDKKTLFERLLEQTDADLYRWVIGMEDPKDAEFAALIHLIRN